MLQGHNRNLKGGKSILFLLMFLAGMKQSFGQEMSFTHLTMNDGLSTNFVNTVCQDKKGFIWVGTENGLQRYDGNNFADVNSAHVDNRLPGLPIDEILPDTARNILWLRMGKLVGRFNPQNGEFRQAFFKNGVLPGGHVPMYLKNDSRGHIIMVIAFSGAYIYNPESNYFEENNAVLPIPGNFTLLNIFQDTKNDLFYLCGKEGLKVFDSQNKKLYDSAQNPLHLPEIECTKSLKFIEYVFIDSHNRFWINARLAHNLEQLYLLDRENNKLMPRSIEPTGNSYSENFALAENHGQVFCYGTNILNIYNEEKGKFQKFYDKTSVSFSAVKKLYSDRDDNLWIISDNGLYEALIFGKYKHQEKLPGLEQSPITSFLQLDSNTLLGTSWGNGMKAFNFNIGDLKLVPDKQFADYQTFAAKARFTWSVVYDKNTNALVAGCQEGNLIRYNLQNHKARITSPGIFGASTIRQVIRDQNGCFWYGTQSGRIIKETDGKYQTVKNYNYSFISKLFLDNQSRLWVCTGGSGLRVIDTKTNEEIAYYNHQDNNNSISSDLVQDIVQLNDSIYLVALDRNLDELNIRTNKFHHIDYDKGLPNNTLYAMVKDKHNNVWMSTNTGITKYSYAKRKFHNYSQKDGLVTITNNEDILYAGALLNNDLLIFGGEKGNYIIFNPDSIGNRQQPHDATITDIRLLNKLIPVDSVLEKGGLHLKYDNNTITINFTALTYGTGNTLDYYYRLKGASDIWVRAEKPYNPSYASLAPGNYIFQVKCLNEDGVQSAHITSLNINISKPYWQTWWFISLMVIVAFIPLYIIYKLRINRIRAVQRIREKVARDLHDDVGSTLTSINILSEMSRNKIETNTPEVKNYLDKITDNSSQMMDAMDDIVWNIKPANDTMDKIEARMREYAANIFEPRNISYKFTDGAGVKSISLNMDVRRSMLLIFKETLNNIAKYAKANLVSIEFSFKNNELLLTITDDGIGFESTNIVYGNGIENMQKRAQSFKGSYTVKSYPGKGTHVLLVIPLNKKYT